MAAVEACPFYKQFNLNTVLTICCNVQAPEVYMGTHQHGTASEWFATGITLHELLTARRPFEASRLQAFRYCRGFPADVNYEVQHQYAYCEDPYLHRRAGGPVVPQLVDALWPEYLYSQSCDHLTPLCRNFVRALLIPDVSTCFWHYLTCIGFADRQSAAPSHRRRHGWEVRAALLLSIADQKGCGPFSGTPGCEEWTGLRWSALCLCSRATAPSLRKRAVFSRD